LIGNDPKVGKLWEQAVVETLGPRFKASTYKETIEGFQAELSKRVAASGLGSNKQAGTGINYARESYSAVRTRFGKLAAAAGIDLKGLQVHHTFDELAKNPAGALDTTNLSFQRGNAGTKGSGHNFAHKVNDAAEAGIKNPGQHVASEMRAKGIEPDVPELSNPHPKAATPDKTPTLDLHAGKAAKAESKLLKSGEELGEKALKESGKGLKVAGKLAKAGRHFAAAIPIAGIVLGQASAAHAASTGDYTGAVLDEAGFIPVAGDLLDAARGGVALGEALDEGLGISDVAAEHGERFENAAKFVGLGEDASRVVGATGAALSSITVAPSIALKRTVVGWFR